MPPWCQLGTLYKGLFTVVLSLIILQYLFGFIIEPRRLETFFASNTTRSAEKFQHHPLIKALINNTTMTKNSTNTTLPHGFNFTTSNFSSFIENLPLDAEDFFNKINTTGVTSCPEVPPYLHGRVPVVKFPVPTVHQLEQRYYWLKPGGHYQPEVCQAQKKLAIIVPFRCRSEHLLLFLQHMHPFLKRQQVDYTIFIIEQEGDGPFNRAMLMNIGFKEASSFEKFDCFIFHDIDLLPEDDRNLYACSEQPRHMSVAVDIFKYRLPYPEIFGGVSAITKGHFELLNGFSNSFWGWGGEDDDMSNRIRYRKLHISRYPITIARYTMLTHKKDKPSPNRYEILKSGQRRYDSDGLNNLKYSIKELKKNLLYTWLLVEIEQPS